ncbi:GpE family phage tail protein [Yersinia sp. 1252 StPb PI]|uniref:GpE family phage tail protein n=1 Tax=Yersinia sp. 1252 StPb PI TaxID=3117404 RepID=UPI003B2862DF
MGLFPTCGGSCRFFATQLGIRGEQDDSGNISYEFGFSQIEDVIADVAFVFHWSLPDLWAMTVPDLLAWRERAAVRWGTTEE